MLHDADRYGQSFADVYDDWYGDAPDTAATLAALRRLAGPGPVLELGVGTGRLALPLAGVAAADRDGSGGPAALTVVGVEASTAMVERLAAKPGAGAVPVVVADMADVDPAVRAAAARRPGVVPARGYRLAFCTSNTFLNLHTEAAQRACLEGVAALLAPDGVLALEVYVPAAPADVPRTALDVARVTTDAVVLTATEHDPVAQVVTGQHVELRDGAVRLRPWRVRYLTPEQLDALADAAGLERRERWADWSGAPFDGGSTSHVSLYGRRRRG